MLGLSGYRIGLGFALAFALAQFPTLSRPTFIITDATTFYVCAKASGGTCVYNGDGGTVATPSDDNAGLTKALPLRTLAGAKNRVAGKLIGAVVTIQLADAAGTGTDLYEPNGTIFDNTVQSGAPDATIYLQEQGNSLGAYPAAYLYLKGNDTTPANVPICGAAACSTTATDSRGVVFTHTVARVSGVKGLNFTSSASSSAIQCIRSVCYVENSAFQGTNVASDQEWLVFPYDHTVLRFGGTFTLTNGGLFNSSNLSQINFRSPAGRSNITVSVAGSFNNGIFCANEFSYVTVDAITLTASGAGTYTLWQSQSGSRITWNDDSTFTSPAQTISINGGGITVDLALDDSMINDLCRTVGSLTCNIGNTTTILRMANAQRWGRVKYLSTPTAVTNADTVTENSAVNGPNGTQWAYTSMLFANLGTPANGTFAYCSDCTFANPCAGSGTGAVAKRLNGAWRCD